MFDCSVPERSGLLSVLLSAEGLLSADVSEGAAVSEVSAAADVSEAEEVLAVSEVSEVLEVSEALAVSEVLAPAETAELFVPEEEEPQPAIRPAAKIQVSNKAIFLFIKCCTPL